MRLKLSYYIANRLISGKQYGSSAVIIRIATMAVAISIAVMIIAVAVVKGYQLQIKQKVTGFGAHIQLSRLDLNNSYETTAIGIDTIMEALILQHSAISNIQPFVVKAGIVKTTEDFSGIVLKGVNKQYDWRFLKEHLIKGAPPKLTDNEPSDGILISSTLAKRLQLDTGSKIIIYFVQDPPRARRFMVSGIYNTGFNELDETYAFLDMRVLQKINGWVPEAITGYEIMLHDEQNIDRVQDDIIAYLPMHVEIQNIRALYPQLFEWLTLLDMNVWVIIILMILVACINMTTALLILIVDRSTMIGIFKTIGSSMRLLRSVFLHIAVRLIGNGLLYGNLMGVGICLFQYHFGFVALDPDAYYLDKVPIHLMWSDVLLLNAGSIVVCLLVLILPASTVSRISPIKVLRFGQ
jgi:lipoprotein-releasing system permease protein